MNVVPFIEELMKTELEAYERGKRHLANMMGKDPENFTQEDIDVSHNSLKSYDFFMIVSSIRYKLQPCKF